MNILITLQADDVASRFDLATEVIIAGLENGKVQAGARTLLLSGPSGEELCGLIIKEDISIVICGGIEELHYDYLVWKKIKIIDRVIGPSSEALEWVLEDRLKAGTVLPGAFA